MTAALFVHADGTREYVADVDPRARVWVLPARERLRPFSFAETCGEFPPMPRKVRRISFRRDERMYPPDWQGPLESWWQWETRTRWEERPPTRPWPAHWPQPPSTEPQLWPVDEQWRLEYTWREEGARP